MRRVARCGSGPGRPCICMDLGEALEGLASAPPPDPLQNTLPHLVGSDADRDGPRALPGTRPPGGRHQPAGVVPPPSQSRAADTATGRLPGLVARPSCLVRRGGVRRAALRYSRARQDLMDAPLGSKEAAPAASRMVPAPGRRPFEFDQGTLSLSQPCGRRTCTDNHARFQERSPSAEHRTSVDSDRSAGTPTSLRSSHGAARTPPPATAAGPPCVRLEHVERIRKGSGE